MPNQGGYFSRGGKTDVGFVIDLLLGGVNGMGDMCKCCW